jgi:hypothetical protein
VGRDAPRPPAVERRAWTPFADTLATVAAGRTAAVAQLRELAAALEALPLDSVAEVLVLLEPTLEDLRRHAGLALERAPADRL